MGNYNCCGQQKPQKSSCKIRSLNTSPSLFDTSLDLSRPDLEQQFRKNYHTVLENLSQNGTQPGPNPHCFNVTIMQKLGRGAQSQVYLVKTDHQTNQIQMALKVVPKNLLTSRSMRKSIAMQNILLQHNTSPFLMNSYFSREDQKNVYFFCPVAKGGDLISFTQQSSGKGQAFNKELENNIRFIAAGIILGLEYLHEMGLIFNDLKLENILIDKQGYPLLTDFGLIQPQNCQYFQDVVGTMTYFSPQKVYQKNYGRSVDFWALGILLYSLYYKQMPFDKDLIMSTRFVQEVKKKEQKHKIRSANGSEVFKNLLNCLLKQQPSERIGVFQIQTLKRHSFFEGLDWNLYKNKKLSSPLKTIVEQYPMKYLNQQIEMNRFKIFRNRSTSEKYLYGLDKKITFSLQKDLFSTRDRLSQPCSTDSLEDAGSQKKISTKI